MAGVHLPRVFISIQNDSFHRGVQCLHSISLLPATPRKKSSQAIEKKTLSDEKKSRRIQIAIVNTQREKPEEIWKLYETLDFMVMVRQTFTEMKITTRFFVHEKNPPATRMKICVRQNFISRPSKCSRAIIFLHPPRHKDELDASASKRQKNLRV